MLLRKVWARESLKTHRSFIKSTKSFLDVGCSTGDVTAIVYANYVLNHKRMNPAKQGLGIDLNESEIKIARVKDTDCPTLRFKAMDPEKIDFKENYKFITSFFSYNQFSDKANVLTRMSNALAKGGKIMMRFIVFSEDPICKATFTVAKSDKWKPVFGDVSVPAWQDSREDLEGFINETGLTIDKFEKISSKVPFHGYEDLIPWLREWNPLSKQCPEEKKDDFAMDVAKQVNFEITPRLNANDEIWWETQHWKIVLNKKEVIPRY